MRKSVLGLICLGLIHTVKMYATTCVVGGSDFETSVALFNPQLSNDGNGWFSSDVDRLLEDACGSSCDYHADISDAVHVGLASDNISTSAVLTAKWEDYATKTINTTSKGFAGVVSNPRTISPYLNEGSGSNQLVIYGNGQNVSVMTYELSGLVPNSTVVVSVDVYNLMSTANLEKALQTMNEGVVDPDDLVTEIKLGRKLSFTMLSDNGGLTPGSGEFSAPAPQLSVSTSMPTGMMSAGNRKTTNRLDWGEKQTLTLSAKADNTGNVTFYFTGVNADFGPLSLDNLRVEGEIEPTIRVVGNPCPKMSAILRLNSAYPEGTIYSWKESSTGETSKEQSMIFFPPTPGDYTVSCTVTTPDGCESSASHKLTVGECCDDGNGPMALTDIYLDDFGRFSGSTYIYRDKKGQEQTTKATEILVGTGNHGYSIDDQLNRGAAFAEELKFSGKNFRNGAYAIATENAYNSPSTMFDASGEKGGAFLQIDMKGDGWLDKVVYEQEITGLCPERLISFSAAVGAINKAPSAGSTNATIQVRLVNSETGEVILADGSPIEDTYVLDKVGWVEPRKEYDFKLPNGVESVKIQIISKEDDYRSAQRGDIALDDIAFRVCTPPNVEVVASSKNDDLLNLCMGDDLVLEAKIKAKEYFEKPVAGYLFQFTKKDPADPDFDPINDWMDLGDVQLEESYLISDPATHIAFAGVEGKEKVRFRVVIGEYEYLKNQRALWETLDELSPCRNVSFSTIPVEAALNCDVCEPVDKASIISADPSTLITTNTNHEKEVILCPGEVANLTTEPFAPANPNAMGINAGSSNEPRKYLASWHKGSKNALGIAGAGSSPGDPVSFYNVTWEDSDWYYLLVKDMEFPEEDGKHCWRWDSIHVIQGTRPTDTLAYPKTFCEGMFKAEEQPTMTISGFKIDWYDGADSISANSISKPEVGNVTQNESPKSFWYVLTEEKSGCRGDMTKYVVTVQSVAAPLASPITYLKTEVESGNVSKPTVQSPNAIVQDASCHIVWYNEDETGPINETEATPTPADVVGLYDNLTKKYKIKQVNELGCESGFVPVSIVVSGYPAPTVRDFSVCENSPLLKDTLVATINGVDGGNSASEFKLVWYKSNDDGTIIDSQEFDKIDLSPSIQKASATEKTKKYTYYVRQRLKSNPAAESAPAALTVTVYTNPKLAAVETAPKCLGESQNLKKMFNISIEDCEVHFDNGSLIADPEDVKEAGVYKVIGSYVINKGEADEQTCSSDEEELNVVFHELKVDITGDDKTCPNSAVVLDLDLTLGGGLTEDKLVYSWSNNLNNTKANTKVYNTGTAGLNKAGDVMKVTVEVSSAACRGISAEKEITVGDSPLNGNIKFSETDNTQPLSKTISSSDLIFNSCGGVVTVELSDVVNKNGGSYDLTGTKSSTGTFTDETAGSATLSLGVGSYTVSYINGCATKFSFKIVDNSAKAGSRSDGLIKCEGDQWWAEIVNLDGPNNTVIEWQHDGTKINGQTGKRLNLRELKPSDSGVYSYSLLSGGCRFDNDVTNGDKLVVKPIAKFDKSSFKDKYEVINGEPLSINIGFSNPSSQNDIADGVKWTGYTNPNGLSLTIPSVEREYSIHVTAENDLYCRADTDIVVSVDARLKMEAKLDKYVMCEGERHQLIVDTTGTGTVLHPGLVLTATETIGTGSPRVLTLVDKGDILVADISPSADASYNVVYTYPVGSQDSSLRTPLNMKVYEAVSVEISDPDPVCGDGVETVTIDVTPNAFVEELDWSNNPEGEVSGNTSGATITPVYNGSGVESIIKQYTVVAKNQHCEPDTFFIPVEVHKPLEGQIVAPSVVCGYDDLHLDASSYQAESYEWLYEETKDTLFGPTPSLVPDPDFANFTLSVRRGECVAENSIKVKVVRAPVVASIDSITYKTIQIQLDEESAEPYLYIIDGNDKSDNLTESLRSVAYGKHTLKVVDQFGCKYDTVFIVNYPAIEIPIFITPDGNGENDRFEVKGLADGYPDAVVTIYDRWGKKLAKYRAGDDSDWDGVYNGNKMPSTDYWYEISIDDIDKTYTGHFTLLR
ncbi:MAG: T9SS type B sorting domain-containing protein [Paludibacteraceae bacterium]|nr:T9SS type B sorting domain-containing protein [Paludibacteraceae bacterium]